jgi:hypothetical protein
MSVGGGHCEVCKGSVIMMCDAQWGRCWTELSTRRTVEDRRRNGEQGRSSRCSVPYSKHLTLILKPFQNMRLRNRKVRPVSPSRCCSSLEDP